MLAATRLAGFAARRSPTVQGRASYVASASSTSHTVNLPSGVQAGELLLIFWSLIGSSTTTASASGWSVLYAAGASLSRACSFGCLYKVADGSEGSSASVTLSAAASSMQTYAFRIKDGKSPTAGTAASGSSGTTSDPPAVSPSGGAVPSLFIAVSQFTEAANSLSAYPSGYENGQWQNNSNGNSKLATAERQGRATSENPGVLTWSGSGSWFANTVAVAAA